MSWRVDNKIGETCENKGYQWIIQRTLFRMEVLYLKNIKQIKNKKLNSVWDLPHFGFI